MTKDAEGFSLPFRIYLHPSKSRVTVAEKNGVHTAYKGSFLEDNKTGKRKMISRIYPKKIKDFETVDVTMWK